MFKINISLQSVEFTECKKLCLEALRVRDAVIKLYPWRVHEEFEMASVVIITVTHQEVYFFYCQGAVKEHSGLDNINL